MNTLLIKSLFVFVASLINMPWLKGTKTRHEQEKEPNYSKTNLFQMRIKNSKNMWKKIFFFQSSLPEVFLKNTVLESLVNRSAAWNFVEKGTPAQFFSHKFCEFSGRLLLSIATICQEHLKLNMRRMTNLLISMTSA